MARWLSIVSILILEACFDITSGLLFKTSSGRWAEMRASMWMHRTRLFSYVLL